MEASQEVQSAEFEGNKTAEQMANLSAWNHGMEHASVHPSLCGWKAVNFSNLVLGLCYSCKWSFSYRMGESPLKERQHYGPVILNFHVHRYRLGVLLNAYSDSLVCV